MRFLYAGSGPKADQGYLTLRAIDAAIPPTAWPNRPPIPAFWSFCHVTQSLCGIHISGRQAEIWHWPDIDQAPICLMTSPERHAWYFPTLSPDGLRLAVIATPDRFYPPLHNHPAQIMVFQRHQAAWQRIGMPVPCLIDQIAWQGSGLLFQDRHGRLVRAHIGPDGITEAGIFVFKRAHTPRIAPDATRIAARYGNHLCVDAVELVLSGTICDHGWIDDRRLWAVIDDGFWRCHLIWLDIDDHGQITPHDADFEATRIDQMIFLAEK